MSEARARIIWLHDHLKYPDSAIAEYLGIARESVCRIRKGVYGYSGKPFLDKLQRSFEGPDGKLYHYPNIPQPKPKPIPQPKFGSQRNCFFCGSGSTLTTLATLRGTGMKQSMCQNCYARMLPEGRIE